jgi:hypothetical protein
MFKFISQMARRTGQWRFMVSTHGTRTRTCDPDPEGSPVPRWGTHQSLAHPALRKKCGELAPATRE